MHSRSESASSVGSLGAVHDASLKKLMKDLHRCEVSISRYQTMLNEVKQHLHMQHILLVICNYGMHMVDYHNYNVVCLCLSSWTYLRVHVPF